MPIIVVVQVLPMIFFLHVAGSHVVASSTEFLLLISKTIYLQITTYIIMSLTMIIVFIYTNTQYIHVQILFWPYALA